MPRGMITVVVFQTIAMMVLRRLVAVVGLGPSRDAKDVELAVLHHQLAVSLAIAAADGRSSH